MDDLTECKVKPSNTQCNNIQSTFHTVGYYCPYSCNLCSTQNCQFFEGICGNFGTCSEVTYFGLQTIECSCNSGYFGANCNIRKLNIIKTFKKTFFLKQILVGHRQ